MLPKKSTVVCTFDQAHLDKFIEVINFCMTMTDEEEAVVNSTNLGRLASAGKPTMENLTEKVQKAADDLLSKTGRVTMKVRLRHSLQFILKKGFTASVTASSPKDSPLKIDLVDGAVRIYLPDVKGLLPHRCLLLF